MWRRSVRAGAASLSAATLHSPVVPATQTPSPPLLPSLPSSSSSSAPPSPLPTQPPVHAPALPSTQRLFEPITLTRHITLPNRFVMQPVYLNLERELTPWSDEHMDAMAAFYAERAHYGAKLIIVGGLATSRAGAWRSDSLALTSPSHARALRRVTDAVHREGGFVLAQAMHAGRAARRLYALSSSSSPSPVVPTPSYGPRAPRRLPSWLVGWVVSEYARFAQLAEDAGFDGVEVPVSEGTLLHNFVSPAVNDRDDAFGGTLARRLEVVLRVLDVVKSRLRAPDRCAVSLRLCLHDLREGGSTMAETLAIAEALVRGGCVDVLNTSVGMHDSPVQTLASYVPQGTFARSCRLLRRHLHARGLSHVPVIASHRLHSVAVAARLMATDTCDCVGLARPLLADAQFVRKASEGREAEIVPCIACNHCVNRLYRCQRVSCAVNPIAGFELERAWRPARHRRHIAVIGAGPAGVTCALTLWRRGHAVTLFDRAATVGGLLNVAKCVPGKEAYQDLLTYWTRELRASSVNVRLQSEFTREDVTRQHQFFHGIVLATGGLPRPVSSHSMLGASESPLVVPFMRILDGSVVAGRRVVVLGQGAIAYDVASYLLHDPRVSRSVEHYLDEWGVSLQHGQLLRRDTAVARAPRNGRDVVLLNQVDRDGDLSCGKGWSQKLWLRNHGATILNNAIVQGIGRDRVDIEVVTPVRRSYVIPCDTVVWCMGMLPNVALGTWLREWVKDGAVARGEASREFAIYAAGACRDSTLSDGHGEQDMLQAIHDGYEIGHKI